MNISEFSIPEYHTVTESRIEKSGRIAFFVMAVTLIAASYIYLTSNLNDPFGVFSYSVADFLGGPVLAASLVMTVYALRERLGEQAPRRINLALMIALFAASAALSVALIRSANRQYYTHHPELNLQNSMPIMVVWTTFLAGISATGWHLFGWVLLLVGSVGWTSRRLPRVLSGLYVFCGAIALFVYLLPNNEGAI